MDKSQFEKLKADILTLTPKQRGDVLALLGAQAQVTKNVKGEGGERFFWGCVCDELNALLAASTSMPFEVVMKRSSSELTAAAAACDVVVVKHLKHVSKQQVASALRVMTRLAVEHLRAVGVPVAPRPVLQQLANVAALIDRAFPGYAEAGLLHFALVPGAVYTTR